MLRFFRVQVCGPHARVGYLWSWSCQALAADLCACCLLLAPRTASFFVLFVYAPVSRRCVMKSLEYLAKEDPHNYFAEPVDVSMVPGYRDVVRWR